MDSFTDQHSNDLLNKEWLVRIDNATSQPYLFKFMSSTNGHCSILITDTVSVWFEALDSKHLSRRWRQLNQNPEPSVDQDQAFAWRGQITRKLSSLHTLKSMQECAFSIADSHDADLAFELQASECKWRWECYLLGPKTSAKILSRHLIFPLLSVTHLAFSSADPVCELAQEDLQQAVDKVAKTGRRAHDVHVRQTMSRPRVASTLARMTAMFNFAEPIPPIISDSITDQEGDANVDVMEVHLHDGHNANPSPSVTQIQREPHHSSSPSPSRTNVNPDGAADPFPSTVPDPASRQKKQKPTTGRAEKATRVLESSSATEPETGDDDEAEAPPATSVGAPHSQPGSGDTRGPGSSERDKPVGPSSRASSSRSVVRGGSSDSSQPRRVSKKAKLNAVPEDSDTSGNEGTRSRASARPPSSRPASVARGASVRQPIKRGGRRF